MRTDRKRHRCPVCQSVNLYKRSWATLWKKKSKMKDKYDKEMIKALESQLPPPEGGGLRPRVKPKNVDV